MRIKKNIALIIIVIIIAFITIGNAPAPYWACEGLSEGDECEPYSYGSCSNKSGTCQLREDCTDDPESEINECLQCLTN